MIMFSELERIQEAAAIAYFKVISWCSLGGTEGKPQTPTRIIGILTDSNWAPPEYKLEALLLEPTCSMLFALQLMYTST
jgi:hypothetical protein